MKKRYRRRLWAGLLAVVLLFVGVSSAFRAGMHLGYRWGAMPGPDGEEAAPQGWAPPFYGSRWRPYGSYWGRPMRGGSLGRFLSLLLVLLGVGMLLKAFRHKAWHLHRAHGPRAHEAWGHGHWGHGPWGGKTPCGCEDPAPADEQVAKVHPEPDAG